MWKRLSGPPECFDGDGCPSVWADDENPGELVIVGNPVSRGTVRMADDEVAIRISRQIVVDAKI